MSVTHQPRGAGRPTPGGPRRFGARLAASVAALDRADRALRPLRPHARRLAGYFPWTPLGLGVAAVSTVALRALAYERLDMVWLVLGWAGIGLTVLPLLWVVPVAVYLARRDDGERGRQALLLETMRPTDTGYRLPAYRFFPLLALDLEIVVPKALSARPGSRDLAARDGRLIERAEARDRGLFSTIERRISVSDAFGMCRVSVQRRSSRGLEAHPNLGGLHRIPSLTSFAAGDELPHPLGLADGDRVELSRYVPGDPARFIHWKVFARTRELMVRRPERALSKARRVAAFFVAGPRDDASAGLCRLALMRGLLGAEWRFATAGQGRGTQRVGEAISWLLRSAEQRERGAQGLSAFLKTVDASGPASLMLFLPPQPGPWLPEVVAAVRGRQARALVAVDGLAGDVPEGRLRRLLVRAVPAANPTRAELEQVVQTLARAGCSVSVYDRPRGVVSREGRRLGTQAGDLGGPGVAA